MVDERITAIITDLSTEPLIFVNKKPEILVNDMKGTSKQISKLSKPKTLLSAVKHTSKQIRNLSKPKILVNDMKDTIRKLSKPKTLLTAVNIRPNKYHIIKQSIINRK